MQSLAALCGLCPPYGYSGTDSANDGFIGDEGEACGAFPALDSPLIVEIDDASRTNLDFLVSFGLSTPTVQGDVRHAQVADFRSVSSVKSVAYSFRFVTYPEPLRIAGDRPLGSMSWS
ncbi:hypothetical protein [Panacagrimonas sp.]|uniref:hypothetical protein n=1 Tax=Panacagrimonas sp. TaxID=2480088 RepID=UPI003B527E18